MRLLWWPGKFAQVHVLDIGLLILAAMIACLSVSEP